MKKSITATVKPSTATYEALEEMVRLKAQEYIRRSLKTKSRDFWGERNPRESRRSMGPLDIGMAMASRRKCH